jgi:alpha-tubulin suppressor-like RCC1 family protein
MMLTLTACDAPVPSGSQQTFSLHLPLQLAYVDLGSGVTTTQIAMGPFHTCALTTTGQVKCWGSNLSGELGHSANHSTWGRKPGQMGDALPVTPLNLQTSTGGCVADQHQELWAYSMCHTAKC